MAKSMTIPDGKSSYRGQGGKSKQQQRERRKMEENLVSLENPTGDHSCCASEGSQAHLSMSLS